MILKYRAWDSVKKKFVEHFFITDNGLICNMERPTSGYNSPIPVEKSELILMQSTGLHDKNGKEIFDGDIVTDGDVTSDIKYHQTLGFYMIGKYGFSVPFGQGVDVEYFEEFADHVSKTFEVVGNIYENPELLEVE